MSIIDARAARHSSESNEHYTPGPFVEAARECMGSIDLDPASCQMANMIVGAGTYFGHMTNSADLDGLAYDWFGNVFLNPPGGSLRPNYGTFHKDGSVKKEPDLPNVLEYKRRVSARFGTYSHAVAWWRKLTEEVMDRPNGPHVRQAVFLGFSLEILQSAQVPGSLNMLHMCLCVPSKRIDFLNEKRQPQGAPTHANVIVGVGMQPERFRECFRKFGWCNG